MFMKKKKTVLFTSPIILLQRQRETERDRERESERQTERERGGGERVKCVWMSLRLSY